MKRKKEVRRDARGALTGNQKHELRDKKNVKGGIKDRSGKEKIS